MGKAIVIIASVILSTSTLTRAKGGKDAIDSLRGPTVGGYIQVHYRQAYATGADPVVDNDDFRVQRVRIGIEGDVSRWLSYDLEMDPRAPEVTGLLRDAYVTLKLIPRHKLRIGQQKQQFGYENPESSTRLFTVNRAEVSDALSRGVNLRDIGLGLIGNLKLGDGWRIEDAMTVSNGAGMNVQADDTPAKNVWGRLGLRYKPDASNLHARLGVSGGAGDYIDRGDPALPLDDTTLIFRRLGADLEADHRYFFLAAEYVLGWDEVKATRETDEPFGYYVTLVAKTPWRLGPLLRYDGLGEDFTRWTFGAFWGLPDEPVRVLLNYELRQLRDGVRADDKAYAWLQVKF